MIPPGIALILFGFAANVSIGSMFLGAIIPGLLLTIALMFTTHFYVKASSFNIKKDDSNEKHSLWSAFISALPAIVLPIFIIAGIRFGIFTPTEAASVAAVYCLLLCIYYKRFKIKSFYKILKNVSWATSAIILVLVASSAFSWVATFEQFPQQISSGLLAMELSPTMTLIALACILLILGMFIEGTALVLILGPMFLPVMLKLGIDPIHYGIVFVFMTHLGGISPPVGVVMFTTCSVTGVPIDKFIKAVIPFLITTIIVALLIILFPFISTAIPNL